MDTPAVVRSGGRLGICIAPGRNQRRSPSGVRWERDLDADMGVLAAVHKCRMLVSLLEPSEVKALGVPLLFDRAAAAGIRVLRYPIPDYGVPRNLRSCRTLVRRVASLLMHGQRVVVHCAGGIGRSGMIAACTLVSLGTTATSAIRAVRSARPGAIPSAGQVRFVQRWAASPHRDLLPRRRRSVG